MPLPVAYQNQFNSVYVRGYWLPEELPLRAVILDKSDEGALDRGSAQCNVTGSSDLASEDSNFGIKNGSLIASCALAEDDILSMGEITTLSAISSPSMHHQKSWSFILTRMVLGEVLGQDPKSLNINRVGKPRLEHSQSVILDRGDRGASDRGPICCNAIGSSHLDVKYRNCNMINGSSVASCVLAEDDATLHFNVSHSENLWIIAWSFEHEVGIDVQKIDPSINYQAIMRQFFTKSEQVQVNTISDFFDVWTQKEAVLKLRGLSFAYMPKISTNSAELIPLDLAPEFKAHIAL